MVEWFWRLRCFIDVKEPPGPPITPGLINDWSIGEGILLFKWQRDIIHEMDNYFRAALAEEVAINEKKRLDEIERLSKRR